MFERLSYTSKLHHRGSSRSGTRNQALSQMDDTCTSGSSGRLIAMSPNPRLQRTRSAPLRSPLSRKTLGGPELAALRTAAAILVISLVASRLAAQCSPQKLLRIVTQDASPGVPAGSFATQPKTTYRLGKTFARVEEAEDREHGIHGLVVVNSPDNWMVN